MEDPREQHANYELLKQLSRPHILIYQLFVNPSVLALLQHKSILSALFVVLFLCVFTGACTSLPMIMHSRQVTSDVRAWVRAEVADVRVDEKGKITWREPAKLPRTDSVRGYRIDFRQNSRAPVHSDITSRERQGLWITHENVYFWRIEPVRNFFYWKTGEKLTTTNLGSWFRFFYRTSAFFGSDSRTTMASLQGQVLDEYIVEQSLSWQKSVALGLLTWSILKAWTLALCMPLAATFAVLVCSIFARPAIPARRIIVLYLYTSIPPLLIASVYEFMSGLDFMYVFCVAFLIYHLYVMRALRLMELGAAREED